jgi:hypothetical protein
MHKLLREPLYFMLAGKAVFTVVNESTGNRFTYKVVKARDAKPQGPWFVKVLCGPDNMRHYKYLGCVWLNHPDQGPVYVHGKKSRISHEADSARAFAWTLRRLAGVGVLPDCIKVYHEGRCGRCGKRLTVPQSIEDGYGPECVKLIQKVEV